MVKPDAVDVAMTTGDGGSVAPLSSWGASPPARVPGPGEESAAGIGPVRVSGGCSDISQSEARGRAHNLRKRDLGRSLDDALLAHGRDAKGHAGAARTSHGGGRHHCSKIDLLGKPLRKHFSFKKAFLRWLSSVSEGLATALKLLSLSRTDSLFSIMPLQRVSVACSLRTHLYNK